MGEGQPHGWDGLGNPDFTVRVDPFLGLTAPDLGHLPVISFAQIQAAP